MFHPTGLAIYLPVSRKQEKGMGEQVLPHIMQIKWTPSIET